MLHIVSDSEPTQPWPALMEHSGEESEEEEDPEEDISSGED